ncbi:MAG: molybdopterin-dependent oxidoreductase, partial [Betaproteobacteria bacterium]
MDMPHVTRSTCCYCGTGCGVLIHSQGGRIVGVEGDPDHPANFGRLCTKGSTLHLTTGRATRALYPELRMDRAEARQRVDWETALDTAADRFADLIRRHGPDSVAFYVSGQLLTEDYYVFNKLARALVGTNNIDSNSRLCMSSAASAYTRTLGADAPPCRYEDFDHADLVLVTGANPAFAHPILFRRLMDARGRRPEQKLIVVDPRLTDTAAAADLHLQIEPGTDTVLLGAMLHVLVWEGLIDGRYIARHTSGFEAVRDAVRDLTPANAANVCGVKAEDIVTAARWFGEAGNALSLWCQGLNQSQHGSDNGAALIHLHLATGQLGRAGAGPFSLTGQPNAMGGREAGAMATLLPGHRDLAKAEDRADVASYWGVPALPQGAGRTATEIIDGLEAGSIKAVWIACTNPAQSLPEQARVQAALEQAEFVVLQEAFADTETAAYADLLLPASTWGEKEGCVTNSERRISRVRAAVPPPGEARADWRIARDFAVKLGERLGRGDAARLFAFDSTAAVFAEHAGLTAGRDLDHSELTHAILERDGPQQWPYRHGVGIERLYGDGRFATADGKARFVPVVFSTTAEKTSAR